MLMVSPKKESAPSNSSKNAWRSADDATLVNCLIKQCTLGHQSGSGFKYIAFMACVEALADSHLTSGGMPKTATTCSDHWSKVRVTSFIHPLLDTDLETR